VTDDPPGSTAPTSGGPPEAMPAEAGPAEAVGTGAGTATRRGRLPRWWPVVAVAAALVVAVPTTVILLDEDEPERVQLPLPESGALVGPGGSELASLLVKGREQTFHATYALEAGDRRESLEWWSSGGRVRQDTAVEGEGGTVRTASFKLSDKQAVVCRQDFGQPWTCERVDVPVGGDPRGLIASVQAQLAGRAVAARTEEVNGREARCFSVSAAAGSEAVELCTDPGGIPLRLASAEAKLELTALDRSVPDATFIPPAAP
jgi:hypothetical protein